jgi:tetratricopeptide (TPR) repeat protein
MNFPMPLYLLLGIFQIAALPGSGEAVRLYELGEFQRAADYLSEKIKSTPGEADFHLWLGKSYLKMQRWDDAVREFETAVKLGPNSSVYHLWLGRACGQKASRVAFFKAFGWATRVVKEFETARRLAPDDVDVRFDLLEYYLRSPGIVGGGRDKAETEVREIARLSPNLGYVARAQVFQQDKMWDRACSELEAAILAYPGQAGRYEDLAEFLFQRQNYDGALANARQAMRADPLRPRAKLILAACLIKKGEALFEAERLLQELSAGPLCDDGPAFEEAHYWLGEAYLKQGKRESALRAFETALRFNSEFDAARNALLQLRRQGL